MSLKNCGSNPRRLYNGFQRKKYVPFNGTPEQEKALREMIGNHKGQQGALMPVLQQAQEIYGYLPIEVQSIIAEEMGIPLEKVMVFLRSTRSSHFIPRVSTKSRYVWVQPAMLKAPATYLQSSPKSSEFQTKMYTGRHILT